MELVLLGTGAAVPTQYRWPSSIALQRKREILLFDCGEGTQMQYERARLRPGKLSKIFISHLHGDHFYGLIGLLTSYQLADRERPLDIYGPVGLKRYLDFMQKLSGFQFRYNISVHEVTGKRKRVEWDFDEYKIFARPLDHGIFALGFRVEEKPKPGKFDTQAAERFGLPEGPLRRLLQEGEDVVLPGGITIRPSDVLGPPKPGKKLAICLDTRPCQNAVELAHQVDVLIHDGTFDNSRSDWAESTGHSTVSQAAETAREAGAKRLILSHISARYKGEDIDLLLTQAKAVFPNVRIARDRMRMKI